MAESVGPYSGRSGYRAGPSAPVVGPNPVDEASIPDLVEQIQAGIRREENFEKLFHRFRSAVRNFFSRKGFTPEDCRDLTQDVFFRVFKGIGTFRHESRFERWLWEVATNIYLNEVRRRKTEKRDAIEQPLDHPGTDTESGSPQVIAIPADELSPEEDVILQERLEALRSALHELPDQMRRACLLRYEKGLKYQEIAHLMNISIETVKAHLHQARKRLAGRLGSEVGKRETEP